MIQKVYNLKVLNPEIPKILKKGKLVRLDIKADIGEERYVIELPKFNPKKADKKDLLNAWLTFLKNPSDALSRKIAEIDEAYEALKDVSADEEVRRTYQAILDKENDIESNQINSMKVARAEGEQIGEAIGIEKGKAEGEKIGIEKGVNQTKVEMAKKLLAMGLPVEQISQPSGLSIE